MNLDNNADAEFSIKQALLSAAKPAQLPKDLYQPTLDVLEAYECWVPALSFLNEWSRDTGLKTTAKARTARILLYFQGRKNEAAKAVAEIAASENLSFEQIEKLILTSIVDADDFQSVVFLLENCWQSLKELRDRVKCVERICLLYEKKVHDEDRLYEFNSKLIKIDPNNHKALRYFKMISAQAGDWGSVENYLARLVSAASHPKDVYRLAQELAAVQLYQLDKASESLATVRRFCSESHLDTSMIEYDAYHRLADWRGCSSVLRKLLVQAGSNKEKSVLSLKIAIIEETSSNFGEALQRYEDAFEFDSNNAEALERLIQLLIKKRDWKATAARIKQMMEIVEGSELRKRLRDAVERIETVAF
jgi:hypothetical protein